MHGFVPARVSALICLTRHRVPPLKKKFCAFETQWQREGQFSAIESYCVYKTNVGTGTVSRSLIDQHKTNSLVWGNFCIILLCIGIVCLTGVIYFVCCLDFHFCDIFFKKREIKKRKYIKFGGDGKDLRGVERGEIIFKYTV